MEQAAILDIFYEELLRPLTTGALHNCIVCMALITTPAYNALSFIFQKDELLEISSRRAQQPPASITLPDCFGFLFKLGARWHQWKRRYCVLKDASLFLYHEAEAQQAIGTVSR